MTRFEKRLGELQKVERLSEYNIGELRAIRHFAESEEERSTAEKLIGRTAQKVDVDKMIADAVAKAVGK